MSWISTSQGSSPQGRIIGRLICSRLVLLLLWEVYRGSVIVAEQDGIVFGVSGFMYSWLMRGELGGIGEQVKRIYSNIYTLGLFALIR